METITRENVANLTPGQPVTKIHDGQISPFYFLGVYPNSKSYFFAYNSGDAKRTYIPKEGLPEWYIGYDSVAFSKVAIKQLKDRIESTKEIYGKEI